MTFHLSLVNTLSKGRVLVPCSLCWKTKL